jgi:hypothetical protein
LLFSCCFDWWSEHVLNFENVYCPANVKGKAGNNDPATKVEGEMEKVSKGWESFLLRMLIVWVYVIGPFAIIVCLW